MLLDSIALLQKFWEYLVILEIIDFAWEGILSTKAPLAAASIKFMLDGSKPE